MRISLRSTVVVLLIFTTILTIVECIRPFGPKKDGTPQNPSNRTSIKDKIKSNGLVKFITKHVGGSSGKLTEDNVDKLVKLVLNDADLIKLAAYKKLVFLYKNAKSDEDRKPLIYGIIKSATELIYYYFAENKGSKAKTIFKEGQSYANKCIQITNEKGPCLKWKALLDASLFFNLMKEKDTSLKKEFTRVANSYKSAVEHLPNDKMLVNMSKRIGCEFKIMEKTRPKFIDKIKSVNTLNSVTLFGGPGFDCLSTLLQLKGSINDEESGIYPLDYFHLIGRVYENQGEWQKAMEKLLEGRYYAPMLNQRARFVNKKMQDDYEKIYLSKFADK
ncbi:Tetratricopeptide-like helical domain [Cinara cedri]|uniref:Tetratricopeptide-like helical domain n=1 Tax=Cinara cedri TaxID=506608 RepID=A0A5E4LYB9_9HEMI|nr:Tetratricopeptide-like helical domain [Cinara cedri]